MQIDPIRLAELDNISLARGAHSSKRMGMCAMEAVAWLAGEEHSDSPQCVCPVVAAFVRRMNDRLRDDSERTRLLRPLLPVLIGTKSTPEVERRRAFLAADWSVRVSVPMLLRALGHDERAAKLEACAEVVGSETALAAREVARGVRAAYTAYTTDVAYNIYVADAVTAAVTATVTATYTVAYAGATTAYIDTAAKAASSVYDNAAYKASFGFRALPVWGSIWESATDLIKRMCATGA